MMERITYDYSSLCSSEWNLPYTKRLIHFFIKSLNGNICVLSKHLKPCVGLFCDKSLYKVWESPEYPGIDNHGSSNAIVLFITEGVLNLDRYLMTCGVHTRVCWFIKCKFKGYFLSIRRIWKESCIRVHTPSESSLATFRVKSKLIFWIFFFTRRIQYNVNLVTMSFRKNILACFTNFPPAVRYVNPP